MSMGKLLRKSYHVLFLLAFAVVTVQAIWTMMRASWGAALLLLPLLLLLFFAFPRMTGTWRVDYKKAWIVLQAVSVIVMLTEMYLMELKLSWDWQLLITTAYQYAAEGGENANLKYFATYSNNQFWLACLIVVFKIAHRIHPLADLRGYKWLSMLMAGTMTQLALFLIYQTARLHFSEKKAFLTGCFAALFLPVYLYAKFAYTDVPGMFLASLILYLYSMLKKAHRRRGLYLVLTGCITALAFKVKVTVFILFIAIVIEELLSKKEWKTFFRSGALVLLSLMITLGGLSAASSHIVVISEEMQEEYGFPVTHWVMMGLKKRGGYNDSDVEYTKSFSGYEEKKAANIRKIKKRISKYGAGGLAKHILVRKLRYTWCRSLLAGDYYGAKYPYRENAAWQLLAEKGRYHWITLLYAWPYYILILLGLLCSGMAAFRSEMDNGSFFCIGRLALLGLFLFLSVWECNSRYLVCFIPVLILTSSQGIFEAKKYLTSVPRSAIYKYIAVR